MDYVALEEDDIIIQLNYEDEAERKRVEYAADNDEDVECHAVKGLVRALRGDEDDVRELIEKIDSKTENESDFNYGTLSDVNEPPLHNREHVRWDYDLKDNQEHLDFYLDGIMDGALDRGATPERISENSVKVLDRELGVVNLKFDNGDDIENDLQIHVYGREGSADIYGEVLSEDMEDRFGVESAESTQLEEEPEFI